MNLTISKLRVSIEGKEILHGVNLTVEEGKVHAVMGPNGSGKSTLASAIMGHPSYAVGGKALMDGVNLLDLPTEARARKGIFLAFQSPVAVSGVTVSNLLREAYRARYGKPTEQPAGSYNPAFRNRAIVGGMPIADFSEMIRGFARKLTLNEDLLRRGIHDGFSGGEKKKIEMLEALVLNPKFAIFDEIDTGLDVDALKAVSYGIGELTASGTGVIVITHYQRILQYVKPDFVHVLVNGRVVKTGPAALAREIERKGYAGYTARAAKR